MANLILLCARHHRAVHEGRYEVCTDAAGQAVFYGPAGRVLAGVPPRPPLPRSDGGESAPTQALLRRNRDRGVAPDWRTGWPKYRHDRDIPWAMEAAALEAVERELIDEAAGRARRRRLTGPSTAHTESAEAA